jgi:hypothetical protein
MWKQLERYLPEFESAVLSGVDREGYPYSVRCQPSLEAGQQRLRVGLPTETMLQPGPACLLCHRHDEHLWNLKSFVVRGRLEQDGEGWLFCPEQFIPGVGIGGWRSYVNFVRNGRAATRAYYAKRGLPVPKVQWEEYMPLLTGQPG